MMKDCWIIIPVHNRCEMTRACLTRLKRSNVLDSYTVCVVDDASTDGTGEMLAQEFPTVIRVEGDGNLFWGGGIALGMEHARANEAEVYFWLNDDCLPHNDAISILVERVMVTKGICGGVCYEEDGETVAYSGSKVSGEKVIPPKGKFLAVELLNGNMVAIHREVVEKMGCVDAKRFPHYGGDSIYGLEASRNGVRVEIAGGATGVNPRGDYFYRFGRSHPALAVWKDMTWRGSPNYYPAYWAFLKSVYGWKAYYRWPAFFVRLVKKYFRAKGIVSIPAIIL